MKKKKILKRIKELDNEIANRIEELNNEIVNLRERIWDLESNKTIPYTPHPYVYPSPPEPWEIPTKTWPISPTYPGVHPYPYIVTC